ncbi:MAG TPA: alpha/beta fold hydrolase [Hyphomonadaceae bacterium]|nr:alpha/beta fold hydrolase [Hyphomonadaceae bacterium]
MRIPALVLTAILTALPAFAAPPVGEIHRTVSEPAAAIRDEQHRTDLRITVWYPAAAGAAETSIDMGPPNAPFFTLGKVAMNGAFADDKKHPVILFSHGFGGSARMMAWFGKPMAEHGYVVIAVDHPGNNGQDKMTVAGAMVWWERAEDLKWALAAALKDSAIGPHLDATRVGVAGYSLGGLTSLVLGGARVSPEHALQFCAIQPDDGVCKPQQEFPLTIDQWKQAFASDELKSEMAVARTDHSLPGVKAVFALSPVVQVLDPDSLKAMRVPVSIVVGDGDPITSPANHGGVAAKLIPGAKLSLAKGATHYTFLAECSDAARQQIPICKTATEQASAHALAIEEALELFDRTLR